MAVCNGPNPSFDYYLAPRLAAATGLDVTLAELRRPWALKDDALDDALVLFCRYVSASWLGRLERRPPSACALFLDDDLAALAIDPATPPAYRRRVWRWGPSQWPSLARRLHCLMVSTPVLAERFAGCGPVVLPPLAGTDELRLRSSGHFEAPKFGFHATAVHVAEHRWLAPIVRAVLDATPGLQVEVVANGSAARFWDHPRVHVAPQRPWPEYKARQLDGALDLLLAPLLPGRANQARAAVKRIDAARVGAALVVSDAEIYGVTRAEREEGMHLPLDANAWIEGLTALAGSPDRLRRLAALNRQVLSEERSRARPLVEPAGAEGWWRLSSQDEPGPA
ncbi:hypothetical protein [Caulobacter sp. S45]|uniref:hypothetical protein n=1 Tax=Caulobacter sp. S45 TaxID=1641861 RepID=UPI001576796C|nr:hypothetical protein [Caulobacter sp. S45]